MKKRDRTLILIELVFTLTALSILGYMLNFPSGKVVSQDLTLKDYPRPFLKSNDYNFIFTTSDEISQEEYNCAISILSGMKEAPSPVSDNDLSPIGDGLANNHLKSSIRQKDLSILQESTVSLAGNTIDVHDEINLGKIGSSSVDVSSPSIESSLTKNKEYGSSLYLNIKPSAISYHYVFDSQVDLSKVNEDNPLKIKFLGSDLTITKVNSDTEFTGFLGTETLLRLNDQLTVSGKVVKVEDIGLDSVVVSVDGEKAVVRNGASKSISGLQVLVSNILFNDQNSMVSLVVGKSISDSYKDGQKYGSCDSRCFVWDINSLLSGSSGDIYTSGGPTLGIRNEFDIAGELSLESCVDFPNSFAKICFEATNVDEYSNYHVFTDSIDVSKIMPHLSSVDVIAISSGHNEGIELSTDEFLQSKISSKRASSIYLRPNNSNTVDVFYQDEDGIAWAGTYSATSSEVQVASIRFDKTSGDDIKIISQGQLSSLDIIFSSSGQSISNDEIIIRTQSSLTDITKVLYGQDEKDISSYDIDQTSRYGIILSDIQDGIDSDDIGLRIPGNQVKAKITINGQQLSSQSQASVPEIIPGSKLIGFNQNVIAIGKSNPLYSKLVPEGWQYEEGQAVIKLVKSSSYYILLVAGSSNDDLKRACNVLSEYESNRDKLKGLVAEV